MQFIVKITETATANNPTFSEGERHIHYIGKSEGFSQDIKDFTVYHFIDGWKHKRFAENYIKKDKAYYEEHDNGMWTHEWEIIEI